MLSTKEDEKKKSPTKGFTIDSQKWSKWLKNVRLKVPFKSWHFIFYLQDKSTLKKWFNV